MRGKRERGDEKSFINRLIPAHAGKTSLRSRPPRQKRAHPRACGENLSASQLLREGTGSSPRMRGKPPAARRKWVGVGLIPAHAGKTRLLATVATHGQAHPRACGENFSSRFDISVSEGSSPRMRGKRYRLAGRGWSRRLIPAHAGKTRLNRPHSACKRAHPRACGENLHEIKDDEQLEGSSPRMRGKRLSACIVTPSGRLIPAHAGKTREPADIDTSPPAHPRACGENLLLGSLKLREDGSSPRMRGKPAKTLQPLDVEGLIPAHAGKTSGALR